GPPSHRWHLGQILVRQRRALHRLSHVSSPHRRRAGAPARCICPRTGALRKVVCLPAGARLIQSCLCMLQTFDERNHDLLVNINGTLVHRDQARISPFDSVVQGGDGVWEGLRLYQGRIFKLIEHLDRLRGSAKALAFTEIPSHETLIRELRRTLEANEMTDGVHIRLTLTRGEKVTSGMDPRLNQFGPTLIILPEFKPPVYNKGGLRFITSSVRRFPPDCLDPKIHHNNLLQSILAKIEANVAGCDSALMLDKQGFIAEANGTHVFIVEGETVVTSHTDA